MKDAGPAIHDFIAAVRAQTRPPDEVIVVDGGSSDGTLQALQVAKEIHTLSEPGANISRGRNLAIHEAAHDLIAVTDADCVPSLDWLERLLSPLEAGRADVAAGFYLPAGNSFLQMCAAAVALPDREEIGPGWMPSSRSLAFTRDIYEAAGGYPEWLDVGEDMFFNHRMLECGASFELVEDAVTHWEIRSTLRDTWTQYVRYAKGDALGGMYPERHLIRIGTYAFAASALASRRRWMLMLAGVGAAVYARKPLRRAWRRFPARAPERLLAIAAVPALMAFIDAAKLWGYGRGLLVRLRPRQGRGQDRRRAAIASSSVTEDRR